jgi:hypothetical protein
MPRKCGYKNMRLGNRLLKARPTVIQRTGVSRDQILTEAEAGNLTIIQIGKLLHPPAGQIDQLIADRIAGKR